MKLTDYSKVQNLGQENVFLLDGPDGTKTILAPNLAKALIGMLTSDELVAGLKLSDLTKVTTLATGDYVMVGPTAGNRAMTAKNLAKSLLGLLTSQEFISALTMGSLTQTAELTANDNILVGTTAGNKYMKASDAFYAMLDAFGSPELHRNVFGGRNLGTSVTDAQKTAIQNGTFKGLFVGDYWVINSVNWRIADIDYFYNTGNTAFTKHHLVIVPDKILYNAKMNDSSTTGGGYYNSAMYKTNLDNAKATIEAAFPDLVLTHRDYLTNAVTNGHPSGVSWYNSTVELMNEIMVYGSYICAAVNDGVILPYVGTTGKQQFALFSLDPKKISTRETYWLRDVASSTSFAYVTDGGIAFYNSATISCGVRPYFCIG